MKEKKDKLLRFDENMEGVRHRQLYILEAIDSLCQRHGIRYWLDFGTLLGAFRGRGYIPWDDDVDIGMLREDYERFLNVAKTSLPADLQLQDTYTDSKYYYLFSKVRDTKSNISPSNYMFNGIFVDIFPYDAVPARKTVWQVQWLFSTLAFIIFTLSDAKAPTLHRFKRWQRKFIRQLLKVLVFITSSCSQSGYRLVEKKLRNFAKGSHEAYSLVVVAPGFRYRTLKKKSEIFPLVPISFEGRMLWAPRMTEVCLERLYGADYMTPRQDLHYSHIDGVFFADADDLPPLRK